MYVIEVFDELGNKIRSQETDSLDVVHHVVGSYSLNSVRIFLFFKDPVTSVSSLIAKLDSDDLDHQMESTFLPRYSDRSIQGIQTTLDVF